MTSYIKLFLKNILEINEHGYSQIDSIIRRAKGQAKWDAIHDKEVLTYITQSDMSDMKLKFILTEMLRSKDVLVTILLQVSELEPKVKLQTNS